VGAVPPTNPNQASGTPRSLGLVPTDAAPRDANGGHYYRWSLPAIGVAGSGEVIFSRRLPGLRHSLGMRTYVYGSLMRLAVVDPGLVSYEEERGRRMAATRNDSSDDNDEKGVDLLRTGPEELCAIRRAACLQTVISTSAGRPLHILHHQPFQLQSDTPDSHFYFW
jgi:hypothetical protein